jgi:hypothetical protein
LGLAGAARPPGVADDKGPRVAEPRLPGSTPPAAVADGPSRTRAAAGAPPTTEAEAIFGQTAEETGQRVSGELQNVQLMAMAERNRQMLAATYLPEPALPSDPAKAADDVRPSDVDQPWR